MHRSDKTEQKRRTRFEPTPAEARTVRSPVTASKAANLFVGTREVRIRHGQESVPAAPQPARTG